MADDERGPIKGASMDQVKITLHKDMCSPVTTRYKFDIVLTNTHGANHFSFVRLFALYTTAVLRPPDRAGIAKILREEHAAAWERYHKYVE